MSRPYSGTRCDFDDLMGAVHVLMERVKRNERPEFHRGAAAVLEIIATQTLRDQDELMVVLDAIHNESKEFYRVPKEVN